METSKTRLHPLLTAAAISVTVFSAVGVAAMTGVLPHTFGSSKQAAPITQSAAPTGLEQVEQRAAATAPTVAAPSVAADMPPAAPVSTPKPKPAPKKHVVAKASAPQYEPVTERDFAGVPPPPPPSMQPQAQVEAPKPVPAGVLGVVESVREVSTPAKESNGVGPIAGGIAGAVLGNQIGHGNGRTIATILGGAAGAFGGKEVEKQVRSTKSWEVTVRLDDGSVRKLPSTTLPYWHGGERVRFLDGRLTPA